MYFPQNHGNYYFRPYNYHTILHQQQSVGRYGGDRRNPYDNSLFQALYEEVKNGENQEVIAVPDPLSAALTPRVRENEPAPVLRDEGSNPPKVFIEPVALESIHAKSSDTAFRVRFITDK
jgi:hypothetical protein